MLKIMTLLIQLIALLGVWVIKHLFGKASAIILIILGITINSMKQTKLLALQLSGLNRILVGLTLH